MSRTITSTPRTLVFHVIIPGDSHAVPLVYPMPHAATLICDEKGAGA